MAFLDFDEILHWLKFGVLRGLDVRGDLFDVLKRPSRVRCVVALAAVGGGRGVVGAVLAVEAKVVVMRQCQVLSEGRKVRK